MRLRARDRDTMTLLAFLVAGAVSLVLSSIAPTSVTAGAPNTNVTLNGSGFVAATQARAGATALTTMYVSPAQLTAVIPASLLTTAGDLLFTGDPEGYFFALDARSGEKLWSFQTGSGLRGSPVTFRANGRQYVVTPSGWGSLAAGGVAGLFPQDARLFRGGSALFAFALPEDSAK